MIKKILWNENHVIKKGLAKEGGKLKGINSEGDKTHCIILVYKVP